MEIRGKVTHASDDALCQEPPYTPSPNPVKSQGGGLGWDAWENGHLRAGQGGGWRLVCLAVGWAAGLHLEFIQIDHLDALGQLPLPEQTQEGSLEKHGC